MYHVNVGHRCIASCDPSKITGVFGDVLGDLNIMPGACGDSDEPAGGLLGGSTEIAINEHGHHHRNAVQESPELMFTIT